MFTSKAQADAYTRTFNELLDWTEKAIERIADMAASAYEERIWEMYEDCNSWESYVRVHLHTNRIKLTVPERRAVVVKLYHERGLTQQQTADVLGVATDTVSRDLKAVSEIGNSPTSTNAAEATGHHERGGRPRKTEAELSRKRQAQLMSGASSAARALSLTLPKLETADGECLERLRELQAEIRRALQRLDPGDGKKTTTTGRQLALVK